MLPTVARDQRRTFEPLYERYARVARELGFRYTRKPYSPSPRLVVEYPTGAELHAQLRELMDAGADLHEDADANARGGGAPRTLPRMSVLKEERPELYRGVIHDGGHHAVSARMGVPPVSKAKGPKMSFDDVVRGIREFNAENGVEAGSFPSQRQLHERDRCDAHSLAPSLPRPLPPSVTPSLAHSLTHSLTSLPHSLAQVRPAVLVAPLRHVHPRRAHGPPPGQARPARSPQTQVDAATGRQLRT